MIVLVFAVAIALGAVLFGLFVMWKTRSKGQYIIVDRWWMENEERWEWLRRYEIEKGVTATPGQIKTLKKKSYSGYVELGGKQPPNPPPPSTVIPFPPHPPT